ncbi:fibronectin type III domain-containing protein [Catellatospora tritici]|uniref:fibronectin type III domain-containing protein n=1 Tax=Catellatospora tritici TaxID=2851566 RepID=UPI0020C32026|nr:glycosyl hydrolase family 18 protein [Catellatospora tritici]
MNRLRISVAAAITALVATVAAVALAAPAGAAELISNGGFESGSLSPWTCSGGTGSVVSTPVRTGTKSLQGAASSSDNANCTQNVATVSGTSYTLTAWVRGNYVYLGVTGGASNWTPSAANWTQLTVTFTASSTSTQVFLHGWYGQGTYYADDVSLQGQGGTSVPGVPGTPVAGTITNTSIALSWAASSGTVSGYRVYEGSTVVSSPTGTSATISGLAACSTHTYSVAAYNSTGESARSGSVTVTTTGCTTGVPGPPSNLRVTGATDTSLSIAWNAGTGTISGYRVYEGSTLRTTTTALAATLSGLGTCSSHTYTVKAYNGTGESTGVSVTGTTTGCTTGTLPKHLLTGYWQNFTNGATPLRLSSVPTSYNIVAVAFAEANASTQGAVTFSVDSGLSSALGGYTNAQFTADISTLHSRNQKVILSVGGEKGTVSVSSSTAATNFANSLYTLITTFGFDGVDIDLENGLNATYMEQALRNLRSRVGSNLIITMAPQTIDMQSTGSSYFALALAIKDILTIVHTQFYNSGSMLGCDQQFAYSQGTINFMTALACIQLQSALRPDQVALGLPATTQAAGGGYVSPSVVNNALDCLAARTNCGSFVPPTAWPSIRGAMTWSINWDASNGYAFANSVHGHLVGMP